MYEKRVARELGDDGNSGWKKRKRKKTTSDMHGWMDGLVEVAPQNMTCSVPQSCERQEEMEVHGHSRPGEDGRAVN